ncbi:ribonuclease HI [Fervidicella metallireducens AeB]|uniref:Ribonuclease HI n=1 Tax=Fervidicella metallireducens AeB TaxID=1403537 RepID=A0A017RWY6_9CLOT|nr:ribonuclease H family protein [Fervidicella metallireducens]EYE89197.1 ribonuclease HI [Fervidicella metallireducens AeB]
MGKKIYAIKEGFDFANNKKVENLIVNTWDECLKYVKGVKGAKYKSFTDIIEANEYLNETCRLLKKDIDEYPKDWIHAYVDGSYNNITGKYGYALVLVKNDVIIYVENGRAEDDSNKSLRQIAGELKAAVRAAEYAVRNNEKGIVIFHDYEGIFHHAVGTWDRKDESSVEYYSKMRHLIDKLNLEIVFVKVDSHTGDLYNEMADEFAKIGAGVEINKTIRNLIKDKIVYVLDSEVKSKLRKLINDDCIENIKVTEEIIEKMNKESTDIEDIIDYLKNSSMSKEDTLNYLKQLDSRVKDEIILHLIKTI